MLIVNYLAIWISMVTSKKTDSKASTRARTDGRKSLLVYLETDLIKDLKKAALDDDKNVYEIVEESARDWLKRRSKRASSGSAK